MDMEGMDGRGSIFSCCSLPLLPPFLLPGARCLEVSPCHLAAPVHAAHASLVWHHHGAVGWGTQ